MRTTLRDMLLSIVLTIILLKQAVASCYEETLKGGSNTYAMSGHWLTANFHA